MKASFRITPYTAEQIRRAMLSFADDDFAYVVQGPDYVSYETVTRNEWTVEYVSASECYLHYTGSRAGLTNGCAGWGRLRRKDDWFCTVDVSGKGTEWYYPGWTRQGTALLVWWESSVPTNPSPLDLNWRQALADDLRLQRLEALENLADWREVPEKRRLGDRRWR